MVQLESTLIEKSIITMAVCKPFPFFPLILHICCTESEQQFSVVCVLAKAFNGIGAFAQFYCFECGDDDLPVFEEIITFFTRIRENFENFPTNSDTFSC